MSIEVKLTYMYYSGGELKLAGDENKNYKLLPNCTLTDVRNGITHYTRTSETSGDETSFSTIKVGDLELLHNDDDFAVKNGKQHHFYIYGYPVLINDLPCDEETKCLLLLKYTKVNNKLHYE